LLNASTLVFSVFGVLPFLLTDFRLVVASRVAMGLGLCGMMTSAVGLTADYFSGAARQRWLGIQGAAGAAAAVIAAAVAGALAEMNWRLPFLMLAIGFPLFAALMVFRAPPLLQAKPNPDDSVAGRAPTSLGRTLALIFLLSVSGSLTIFPPAFAMGLLLEEKGLGSVMLTGISTSVLAAGGVLGAIAASRLNMLSLPARQAFGFAGAAAGMAALWAASDLCLFMLGAFTNGIAQGMITPVLSMWLLDATPLHLRGRAVGLFQTTFFLAQFACPLAAQALARAVHSTGESMLYYAAACTLQCVAVVVFCRLAVRRSGHRHDALAD
jgi:MFS family permease